jgi:hypothetical protein
MIADERHAGEEGVIRSDIAEMIDRAAAMSVYAYNAVAQATAASADNRPVPDTFPERLAEQTYSDVLRYSLDECACPCHQEHSNQ